MSGQLCAAVGHTEGAVTSDETFERIAWGVLTGLIHPPAGKEMCHLN